MIDRLSEPQELIYRYDESAPKAPQKKTFVRAFLESNIEAVTHLNDENIITKIIWRFIILSFIVLVTVLCTTQIQRYAENRVSTNHEIEYPTEVEFPVIAICNNNIFRLSYLYALRNGKISNENYTLLSIDPNNPKPFDDIFEKYWDMDAVEFLKEAAPKLSESIHGCWWPNGTKCDSSNFEPIWTINGLCYAINTDRNNILTESGSGSSNALTLLLSVQFLEQINMCNTFFGMKKTGGLKLFLYNQSEEPLMITSGVNIPMGKNIDIPFWMVRKTRLEGRGCSSENIMSNKYNYTSCILQSFHQHIYKNCKCSLHGFFVKNEVTNPDKRCNVDEYFGCVQKHLKRIYERDIPSDCKPSCDTTEYTAWQDDLGYLTNVFPIEEEEKYDHLKALEEEESGDYYYEDINYVDNDVLDKDSGKQQQCGESTYFSYTQGKEKIAQSINLWTMMEEINDVYLGKTSRNVEKFVNSIKSIDEQGWMRNIENSTIIFEQLKDVPCFSEIIKHHQLIISKFAEEMEMKSNFIQNLLEKSSESDKTTITQMNRDDIDRIFYILNDLASFFSETSYRTRLFEKREDFMELIGRYHNNTSNKEFLEKLFKLNIHDELFIDYFEGIVNNLISIISNKKTIENSWNQTLVDHMDITMLLFKNIFNLDSEVVWDIFEDMKKCAINEVYPFLKNKYAKLKHIFDLSHINYETLSKNMHPFQPTLEDVSGDFSLVHIFLHRTSIEKWTQNEDYSFWSLASDIGGALDLFLGASLLTMMEVFYILMRHGVFGLKRKKIKRVFELWKSGDENQCVCDTTSSNSEENHEDFLDAVEFQEKVDRDLEIISICGSEMSQLYLTPATSQSYLPEEK